MFLSCPAPHPVFVSSPGAACIYGQIVIGELHAPETKRQQAPAEQVVIIPIRVVTEPMHGILDAWLRILGTYLMQPLQPDPIPNLAERSVPPLRKLCLQCRVRAEQISHKMHGPIDIGPNSPI